MSHLQLGVRLESFRLPFRRALAEVQRLGVSGVQVDAGGEFSPQTLSQTGRRELRHILRSHDLALAALGCPLRRGLDVAEKQEARIEHVQNVMTLSYELGARLVLVAAGSVPDDPQDPQAGPLREALGALSQHGDRIGSVLAIETGGVRGEALARYLRVFDSGSLGVNFDPANLLMNGFPPVESARELAGLIRHVHGRDARKAATSRAFQEAPVGHGDIDWMALLGVLEEVEYRGWLTLVRDQGDNPQADIAAGVAVLRRLGV